VNKLRRAGKVAFVALAALVMVLAVDAPSQARPGDQGFGGRHGGVVHHGFDGHHGFDRDHFGFAFGPGYPYYGYYPYGYYPYGYYSYYGYPVPAYLYYCGSVGAYYPSAQSCPEGWVPVPVT
jgi:hypothetical protein